MMEELHFDILDVTDLSLRYARVLISKRVLRAFAAATASGAAILLIVAVVTPAIAALVGKSNATSQPMWAVMFGILLIALAGVMIGIVVVYVRTLAALARGSRSVANIVMMIVAVWLLLVALEDLRVFLLPRGQAPLQFLALAALTIEATTAYALLIGAWELRRADPFTRSVLEEPRLGAGLLVEIGRLLEFADIRTLSQKNRTRAWFVLSLATLVEGGAFYTILKWADGLGNAAEKPVPGLRDVSPSVLVPCTLVFAVVWLYLSLLLIRLLLRWAKRLRMRARRMTLRSAEEVVLADARPPVLFLRSFEKEHVPLEGARVPLFLRAFDPGAEYGSLEELIMVGLTFVGPVVAVADPSRHDVPEGAARWRVRDDEWQHFVETQIVRAGLIVVGVAETEGLKWEMGALARLPGALEKTIFVCPPGITRDAKIASLLWGVVGEPSMLSNDCNQSMQHLLGVARIHGGKLIAFVASDVSEPAYQTVLRAWTVEQRVGGIR